MHIQAGGLDYRNLNEIVRISSDREVVIEGCMGQRYIGAGLSGREIRIHGTPGNALGAYLDGCDVYVDGNAQDAIGDTMNAGRIIVNGNAGDAVGYAMRGGKIFIRGDAGYRVGIHMKAYRERKPAIVVGGVVGSFLGEYQAGGVIVVLGIGSEDRQPVGNFCGTGMHGGRIFLRTEHLPKDLPQQVIAEKASAQDMEIAAPLIRRYCEKFGADAAALLGDTYYMLRPNSKNPYKQLYVTN